MKHTAHLLEIMAQLRNPNGGCPWDLEQSFASIAPNTIEEAYEVADAIARNDMTGLREELGDLLLQVVFHSQMANEQKLFDFEAVAETLCNKLIARHPHVFGQKAIKSAAEQEALWENIKQQERLTKAAARGRTPSILDEVALGFPALSRAVKLQKRAARVGFDWGAVAPIFDKIEEEIAELREAITEDSNPVHIMEELGDILFATSNLARHLKIDAEEALRATNLKFEKRFHYIEEQLAAKNIPLEKASLEEMEKLWEEAKGKV